MSGHFVHVFAAAAAAATCASAGAQQPAAASGVSVIVKENLYRWVNWNIVQKNHDYEKQDARTVHFPVRIAAGGETTVRYTVQYTW